MDTKLKVDNQNRCFGSPMPMNDPRNKVNYIAISFLHFFNF